MTGVNYQVQIALLEIELLRKKKLKRRTPKSHVRLISNILW